jgi:membrane protease YdiL (CAAX protease family)
MNGQPEHEPDNVQNSSVESGMDTGSHAPHPGVLANWTPEASSEIRSRDPEDPWEPQSPVSPALEQPNETERPMFQQWYVPPPRPPVRTPHLGHVVLLLIFILSGLFVAGILMAVAVHFHLFGVTSLKSAITDLDVRYALGSELIAYLVMFGLGLLFFPMIWGESFFAGIQWNGETALRLRWQLFITASICFVLALVNGWLLPSPQNAPIDKIFRTPGAAWLLFVFGITFAPFFEEMVFRGFILPALCTGCDWINEKISHVPVRPLDEHGQPQWSLAAMVIGSLATSVPFAGMHAAQTGYSLGPFVLLVCVSMVLCWARLSTRSLAASVLVHGFYNFLIFSIMMLGTGGFRHMDKL